MDEDYKNSSSVELTGIASIGVALDFAGIDRSTIDPRMAAFEISELTNLNKFNFLTVSLIQCDY